MRRRVALSRPAAIAWKARSNSLRSGGTVATRIMRRTRRQLFSAKVRADRFEIVDVALRGQRG
jgi:hypothetical protein